MASHLATISIEEGKAAFCELSVLLSTADLISLHCPLSPETRHLLSDKEFETMKTGVFIVNTSRGPGDDCSPTTPHQ